MIVISRYGCFRSGEAGFLQNKRINFPLAGFKAGSFSALQGGSGLFTPVVPGNLSRVRASDDCRQIAMHDLILGSSIFRMGVPSCRSHRN